MQRSEKKQQIIDKAAAIIMEKGVHSTSLSDIAREVGISKGTLYYYYSSKSDLIFDIASNNIDKITEDIYKWINTIKNQSTPQEIIEMVFNKLLSDEFRGKLHLYLIHEAVIDNPELKVKFQQIYHKWLHLLEEGIDKVLGDKVDKKVFSYLLLAALDGFVIQTVVGLENIPLKNIASFITKDHINR